MNINKIENIKKNKRLYVLYINKKQYPIDSYFYECFLPYIGKVIEPKDMLTLIAFSNASSILSLMYNKLFDSRYSLYEFKQKLKSKEISDDNIELIISYLKQEGLLDDRKFIERYKYQYEQTKGKLAFKRFLESKHVSSYYINEMIDNFVEDVDEAIRISNNYIRSHTGSKAMLTLKVKAMLTNKGFSTNTINKVINELVIENENENLAKDLCKYRKKYGNDYNKIVSKMASIGYNINDVKKMLKKEGNNYED